MINNFMQLVPRYLFYNKKRTLAIAFSIIFSVMLLTSVGIIINSFNEMTIKVKGQMYGKYHGWYRNIEYDNLDKPKKLSGIRTVGTALKLGEYQSEKYKLEIIGADNNALDMLNCKIVEGSYPQKLDEIMLEEWIINKMEQKPAIGDKISLDYEMVNIKGISFGKQKTDFILSGIMENSYGSSATGKGKSYVTLQTAEEYIGKSGSAYIQYLVLNTSLNVRQELIKVRELLSITGKNENVYGDYNENISYVVALELAYKSRKLIFFIDVIVALVGVMVIFNVFNISVIERLKHFGLLRAIGATPKQIKYMLLAEAFLLGIICVPLGIVIGIFGTQVLLLLTSKVGYFDIGVKVNLFSIALPFFMGFLSILIAVYNSAKLGARVSPIEAMNTESKIKKKQADIKSLANKLVLAIYGQMGKMALTNIGRYKKRFLATTVTISVSIALFISSFYLIKCLDPVKQMSRVISADYVLTYESNSEKNGYPEEVINQLGNIQGIKKYNKMKYMSCSIIIDTKFLTKEGKEYNEREAKLNDYDKNLLNRNKASIVCMAIGLDEEIYNEYFKDKEETSSYKVQGESLPHVFIMQNLSNQNHTNLNPGDLIPIINTYKENNKWKHIEQEFVIMDTIDNAPAGVSEGSGDMAIFMKEEVFQKYYALDGYQKIEVYLDKGANVQEIEAKLKEITSSQKYGKLISYKEYVENTRKFQTQLTLVLYSIVVVVSLVGLVNIVNTMSMNILLRKREFGILRAMGVTKSQLREMIFKEGLLYGIISSLLGIIMGIALVYLIYYFARVLLDTEFKIDYLSIILPCLVTIILCITTTLIPLKRVTSTSIVESIGVVE